MKMVTLSSRLFLVVVLLMCGCMSMQAFTSGPLRYEKQVVGMFHPDEALVFGPERPITGDIEIPYNVSTSTANWKVVGIKDYAFQGCQLTGVSLSPALRSIGFQAFYNCTRLRYVATSRGLKFIENQAFLNCSALETFEFPESLKLVGEAAFKNCVKLQSVVLGEHVAEVRDWAFAYCRSLTEVRLNCPIDRIPDGCFNYCSSLKEITLPSTVKTIGQSAFEYSGLEVVRIMGNVKQIGYGAFVGASALQTIYLHATTPPEASYMVDNGKERSVTLHVPAGSLNAYRQHPYWSRFTNVIADL